MVLAATGNHYGESTSEDSRPERLNVERQLCVVQSVRYGLHFYFCSLAMGKTQCIHVETRERYRWAKPITKFIQTFASSAGRSCRQGVFALILAAYTSAAEEIQPDSFVPFADQGPNLLSLLPESFGYVLLDGLLPWASDRLIAARSIAAAAEAAHYQRLMISSGAVHLVRSGVT
jgi:hypothetical protein